MSATVPQVGARAGRRSAGRRKKRAAPTAVQEALFEVRVRPERRYFRQMLDSLARSEFGTEPLRAEATISKLLGTVWVTAARDGARDGAAEEAFGLALVDYARQVHTPTSVALLRATASIATIREVREAAGQAADVLSGRGVPEPPWWPPAGAVTPGRCWAFSDIYGDMSAMVCEFGYGDDLRAAARHAIVIEVDHSMFGAAVLTMLTTEVDSFVRDLKHDAKRSGPLYSLRQVDPAWARATLMRALVRTDLIEGIAATEEFSDARALALARVATLAESADAMPLEPEPTPGELRALVTAFLSSPEARHLPDPASAERVATLIAEYGREYDPGQVGRVGPAKWETFLFDWLADHTPHGLDRDSMEPVVRAWSAWAGRRAGLPGVARDELAALLDEMLADNHLAEAES